MSTTTAAGLAFLTERFDLTDAGISRAGNTGVDFAEDLSSGNLSPDVSGAGFAEINLALHLRVDLLHVVVKHGDGDDGNYGGNGGEGHPEKSDTAH